jgi:hypothetical protein
MVNIGVIAFRPSPSVHAFWQAVHKNVQEMQLWDQHVVNSILADADALRSLAVKPTSFPSAVFCNSMGLYHAPYGNIILHHANKHQSIQDKWLNLTQGAGMFAHQASRIDSDRLVILAQLHSATWRFGDVGKGQNYGVLRFGQAGDILDYSHPNEARYVVVTAGILFIGRDGVPTTLFDEFYVDRIRGKLMMVGYWPHAQSHDDIRHIHYLIADNATVS